MNETCDFHLEIEEPLVSRRIAESGQISAIVGLRRTTPSPHALLS